MLGKAKFNMAKICACILAWNNALICLDGQTNLENFTSEQYTQLIESKKDELVFTISKEIVKVARMITLYFVEQMFILSGLTPLGDGSYSENSFDQNTEENQIKKKEFKANHFSHILTMAGKYITLKQCSEKNIANK